MPMKSKGRVGPTKNIKSDVKGAPTKSGGYLGSGNIDDSYRNSQAGSHRQASLAAWVLP